MTIQEAIKWTAYVQQSEPWQDRVIEALDIAIEALKSDRPRGEWEKATESIWKCSLCNAIMFTDSNYCPNCGAKMNGERSGNE